MKKARIFLFMITLFAICLFGCSAQGGFFGEAQSRPVRASEDEVFQQIFAYLEEGEYLKAQELFENDVKGNLNKEDEAQNAFASYVTLVLEDVNAGELPSEKALRFCEAGKKAGFESYFMDFEVRLTTILNSMTNFSDGQKYFEAGNFQDAYYSLSCVVPQDIKCGDALSMIYEIGSNLSESANIDDLLLSAECFKHVLNNQEEYTDEELETDDELKLFQILHDVTLRCAEILLEDSRDKYAATQYATAAGYSSELAAITGEQVWFEKRQSEMQEYARLIREQNVMTEDGGTRYLLTENGIFTEGNDPNYTTTASDHIQLVLCNASNATYGVIDEWGQVRFGFSDGTQYDRDYAKWVELADGSWRRMGIATKIFLDEGSAGPNAIILYTDGAIDIFSSDAPSSYYELQHYGYIFGVLDFYSIGREDFAVLTKDGNILTTPGIEGVDLSSWEDITAITTGHASPAGYKSSYVFSEREYLYGLDSNGAIYYTEIINDSDYPHIAESGCIALTEAVKQIAGGAYLTYSGKLGSLEPLVDQWLQDTYGIYEFTSIVKINSGIDEHNDLIAATTTNGQVIYMNLDAYRYSQCKSQI